MPSAKLTSRIVRDLVCPTGREKLDYFDLIDKGFMVEVRISGGKTYYLRYVDDRGRVRQFKIGPAVLLTLKQARRKARAVKSDALLGGDPHAHRNRIRQIPTLMEFVNDRYIPF